MENAFQSEQVCRTFAEYSEDLARQVEFAQDAFVLLDREFRFAYVNRKASELLERRSDDLLGTRIWEHYSGHIGTELDRQLRRAMQEGISVRFENYYRRLDTCYEFQINPSANGVAVWFRDITEKKHIQQQAEHSGAMLHLVRGIQLGLVRLLRNGLVLITRLERGLLLCPDRKNRLPPSCTTRP
jgi:PAS domain S-box-containing protein